MEAGRKCLAKSSQTMKQSWWDTADSNQTEEIGECKLNSGGQKTNLSEGMGLDFLMTE
jgi:hypothetical protein